MTAALATLGSLLSFAPAAKAATPPPPVLWSFSAADKYPGNADGTLLFLRDQYCPPSHATHGAGDTCA